MCQPCPYIYSPHIWLQPYNGCAHAIHEGPCQSSKTFNGNVISVRVSLINSIFGAEPGYPIFPHSSPQLLLPCLRQLICIHFQLIIAVALKQFYIAVYGTIQSLGSNNKIFLHHHRTDTHTPWPYASRVVEP